MIVKDIDKRNLAMNRESFQATSGASSQYLAFFYYDSSNTGFKVITNGYDRRFQFNDIIKDHYYFVYCELMVSQVKPLNRTIWTEGFDSNYTYTPPETNKWYTYKKKMKAIRNKYESNGDGIRFYGGFSDNTSDPGYVNGSFTTYYRNVVIVDMGTENFDINNVNYRDYLNKSYLTANSDKLMEEMN